MSLDKFIYSVAMTPRSFWIIIVRLLGVWLITQVLYLLQNFVALTYIFILSKNEGYPQTDIINQAKVYGISLVLVSLLFYILVFRTVNVVQILKLDSLFSEETFKVQLNYFNLSYLAVFVIGGLMIVNNIPDLCTSVASYYHMKQLVTKPDINDFKSIIVNTVRIIIGILLITYNKAIPMYIKQQTIAEA